MGVDVDALEDYCQFGAERVYLLLAIARAKDNEAVPNSSESVSRKIVESPDDLARQVAALSHEVRRFDERYRLYLSVNARNTTAAFFRLRERMDDWLEMRFRGNVEVIRKFTRLDREFLSVLQSDSCKDDSNLLFDLDDVASATADEFERDLSAVTSILWRQETPNGYHIVTEPFDYTVFEANEGYELKRDDLLFISSLDD
ncbi:hypothetical protein ACFR9U_21055 [Halorientalis brevis]|uniref:Uncharacterized protein n=1 Tax=Halorientalis brevis TaxID=1126241 RepID=A0ABD6CHX9_9EURY|nr:hypothetical protein [Halorientalis brevis]